MNYGIPYMGSKSKFLDLIDYILQRHCDKEYFIDLFCGGFSVSHYVLLHSKMKVLANDINKYTIALIEQTLQGLPDEIYDFVDREKFFNVINNPDNYPAWYVGYVMQIWSFGNTQRSYIFGAEIENKKRALHNAVVFNKWDESLKEFENVIPEKIKKIDYKKYPGKRLEFVGYFKRYIESDYRLQQLERLEQVQGLQLGNKRVETLTSLDYKEFLKQLPDAIAENAVIYCDPPYENTGGYLIGDIDHGEFWDWVRETPYCVYVSSYEAPSDMILVKSVDAQNTFAPSTGRKATENLYWNGRGEPHLTMEDLLFQ